MGLTEFEYAFYSAVADNESAKELMQKDKLRELAITLTKKICLLYTSPSPRD